MAMTWKFDRVLVRRLVGLLFVSLLGVAVGVLADLQSTEPLSFPPRSAAALVGDVLVALLFAPLVTTVGGFVAFRWLPLPLALLFGVFGWLFCPVYALLAWRWLKTGALGWLLLLMFWCVQGFFQVLHRMELVMSV